MARKRLCNKASVETRMVMREIWAGVQLVDGHLAKAMVPDCEYRGGCHELKSCGRFPKREVK